MNLLIIYYIIGLAVFASSATTYSRIAPRHAAPNVWAYLALLILTATLNGIFWPLTVMMIILSLVGIEFKYWRGL